MTVFASFRMTGFASFRMTVFACFHQQSILIIAGKQAEDGSGAHRLLSGSDGDRGDFLSGSSIFAEFCGEWAERPIISVFFLDGTVCGLV